MPGTEEPDVGNDSRQQCVEYLPHHAPYCRLRWEIRCDARVEFSAHSFRSCRARARLMASASFFCFSALSLMARFFSSIRWRRSCLIRNKRASRASYRCFAVSACFRSIASERSSDFPKRNHEVSGDVAGDKPGHSNRTRCNPLARSLQHRPIVGCESASPIVEEAVQRDRLAHIRRSGCRAFRPGTAGYRAQ